MAKRSKIAKEKKRREIVARYAAVRADLKRRSVDPHLPAEERGTRRTAARGPSSASSGCRGSGCARWPTAANCPAS
jgi:small subunit ribosomal protein S14